MLSKKELIKGIHPLEEALDTGKELRKVFVQSGLNNDPVKQLIVKLRKLEIPFQIVPKEKLFRLAGGNHQGIVGLISPITFYNLESLLPDLYESGKAPLLVMLDGVTDVRNFGAIARSAEFSGVDALIIPFHGGADINDDAIKASAGALLRIKLCRVKNPAESCKYLKDSGIQIIAASEKGTKAVYETDLGLPSAIIFGAEDKGLHPEILKMADVHTFIPGMTGFDSLNVSVAAGIFFYECNRQRLMQT